MRVQVQGAGALAAVRPCASEASEPKTGAGAGTLAAMAGRASNGIGRRVFVCEFLFRAIVLVNFCVMGIKSISRVVN